MFFCQLLVHGRNNCHLDLKKCKVRLLHFLWFSKRDNKMDIFIGLYGMLEKFVFCQFVFFAYSDYTIKIKRKLFFHSFFVSDHAYMM